jgi:transcriptional regulator with XRE-family HTH domain
VSLLRWKSTIVNHDVHERTNRDDSFSQRTGRYAQDAAQGVRPDDAAGLCNVSLPFLNQVEQGKSTAQIGKVLDVCQRFGIEIVFKLPGLK